MGEYNGTIDLISGIRPKNNGDFPLVNAKDVLMPDGDRLSNFSPNYSLEEGELEIRPDTYYVFGEVENLSVSLVTVDDGKAHEYYFEFIPSENFDSLTITPEPRWAAPLNLIPGKVCQVSILRGIGVAVSA